MRWKQTNNYGFFPNELHNNTILIPTVDLQPNLAGDDKDVGVDEASSVNEVTMTKTSSKTSLSHIAAKRLSNGILKNFYSFHDASFDLVLPFEYRFSSSKLENLYGDDNNQGEEEEVESEEKNEGEIEDNNEVKETEKKKRNVEESNGFAEKEEGDDDIRLLEVVFDNDISQNGDDENSFEVCCSLNTSLSCTFSFPKVSYAPGRQWVRSRIVDVGPKSVMIDVSGCRNHVVALRYLWKDRPCHLQSCPLYSLKDLPIMPFVRPVLSDVKELTRFKVEAVSLV